MKTQIYAAPVVKGLKCKQLLLLDFAGQNTAVQSHGICFFTSKQILPLNFADQNYQAMSPGNTGKSVE